MPTSTLPPALLLAAALMPGALAAAEPGRTPERERWSWNQQHTGLTATGDRTWQPQPFRFVGGPSLRHIDYEGGDDAGDGSKARPWKHHPWDPAAQGNAKACEGVHTYVFKGGVIYRGTLVPDESGSAEEPIRLTRDPSWGDGEALLYGSEAVTGWKQGAAHPDLPDGAKIWYADIDFAPRLVWEDGEDGVTRIKLARMPNWTVSDPEDVMSEWWQWEQPDWWEGKHRTKKPDGGEVHLGIDTKHLTGPASLYEGAHVWTEYGIVMGTPFATTVEMYDAEKKALGFQGTWYGASGVLCSGMRYFLEDKPQYLDEGGEFWFERKGEGGRLYLRLPGDRDPNATRIEAAKRTTIIDSRGMSHVHISGLGFRFTNTVWDLTLRWFHHIDVLPAAVRLLGTGDDVRIQNCRFEHVVEAIRLKAHGDQDSLDRLLIADNEILYTDHGAIYVGNSTRWAKHVPPFGPLGEVRILRNRLHEIGGRAARSEHSHALQVDYPTTSEIAGNILTRCYGSGIFLFGGKAGGTLQAAPLSRHLVYANKAEDTLLAANDWGGIETWTAGPYYVFNNISGNANGYWNWNRHKSARLGFAFYCDGSHKNYHFNNIAWGRSSDPAHPHCNEAAFYMAGATSENMFFNNTAAKFEFGTNWSPRFGRQFFLGNVWSHMGTVAFSHGAVKEDPTPVEHEYPHHSTGYAGNVFHATGKHVAVFEASGRGHADPATMRAALEEYGAIASDAGVLAQEAPLRDVDGHDFRPASGSAAIDRGVRFFVPWALSRCVGEWHFRRSPGNPSFIQDQSFNLPSYVQQYAPDQRREFPLQVADATSDWYVDGPLEDWNAGALRFDGKSRFASAAHEAMVAPFTVTVPAADMSGDKKELVVAGAELETPDAGTHNLLVEAYFRTQSGHTGGTIVAKMAGSGYRLGIGADGRAAFTLSAGTPEVISGGVRVNDGNWHHVVAEIDRATRVATVYVDGVKAASGVVDLSSDASLSNRSDLLVGKDADGAFFHGDVEFLRICLGTLADARTSIEELYDWQFDGPFLRDFAGNEVSGERRDAGAFEYME